MPPNMESSAAALAASLVAIGVPAGFLFLVRRLDLYGSGGFSTVVLCFAGGLLAFPAAFVVNTLVFEGLSAAAGVAAASAIVLIKTVVAPIAEETLKPMGLMRSVRSRRFTYFVDGAIFGFAAGTAFAIFENLFYIRSAGSGAGVALSVNRAFSTSLMHGGATALIGVAMGRFWLTHGRRRAVGLLAGWTCAVGLHMLFNRLVTPPISQVEVGLAMLTGLAAVGLTVLFIRVGIRQERAWLRQTLGLPVGVSAGEARVIHRIEDMNALLQPVEAQFGRERRQAVQQLLMAQARLGLRTKASQLATSPELQRQLEEELQELRLEADVARRKIGVYCMAYVRSILPPDVEPLWAQLDRAVAEAGEPAGNLWQTIAARSNGGESA